MKEQEKQNYKKFWGFILLIIAIAIILCIVSIWLYQADGTVNLDRSLPKYIK